MDSPSPERWKELEPLVDRALELAPGERPAFLDQACSGDPALRAEVNRLLRATEEATSFLEVPAPSYVAPLLARLSQAEALVSGTRLGSYEIVRELGRGGMAAVYLAHDPKHLRPVALKVLHPELAQAVGSERFLREIEVIARLQHPHILPLLDSGEADGRPYYVMPYVEGESLRQRLAREKQLPLDAALRIAREAAEALDHAHRHGIIHRDIKPENILLADGQAVVADFGIARAIHAAGGESLTETGLVPGTPAYMSPEQAMGERHLDARVDIYALGAVTYEMLAGEPPFTGHGAQAIAAKVLTEAPRPLTRYRSSVPEHVEAAVLTALEKLPADRFHSAAEFALALSGSAGTPTIARRSSRPAGPSLPWRTGAAALALAAAGFTIGVWATRRSTPAARYRPAWIEMAPPSGATELALEDLVLSPDGSRYLFARGHFGSGDIRLVIRGLADTTETVLEASAGVFQAMWAPDGRSVAFLRGRLTAARTLLILPLDGRPPTVTADSVGCLGAWLPGDTIVYTVGGSIRAVSAGGGASWLVRAGDSSTPVPQFQCPAALPGRWVLVRMPALSFNEYQVGVVSLDGGELRVLAHGLAARYVAPGHLLLAQSDGQLLVGRFDPATATLKGALRPVLSDLDIRFGFPEFSIADDGTLAYQAGQTGGRLVAVGRKGDERVLTNEVRDYNDLAVSPNGRWVATAINGVLWSLDLRRLTLNRLTPGSDDVGSGKALFPVWSPDGQRVAYVAADSYNVVAGDGGTPATLFTMPGRNVGGAGWSPDGRSMLVSTGLSDLHAVDLRTGKVADYLVSRFAEQAPSFSPDGRWVAYASDESGRSEVYVRRFPGPGRRIRISAEGGSEPAWSNSGAEIFYRSPQGFLAAAVTVDGEVVVRRIEQLFDDKPYQTSLRHREYAVVPGDSIFVFIRRSSIGRLFVRFGWTAALDSLLRGTSE